MATVTVIKVVCANCGASYMAHTVPVDGEMVPTGGCGNYTETRIREVVEYPCPEEGEKCQS